MQRAAAAGAVKPWRQRVHAPWPAASVRDGFVPVPNMPALVRHLSAGLALQLGHAVQRLQRSADGWRLVLDDGSSAGPFEQVVLAMPPAQAAALLVGHHDDWAAELAAVRMEACWTLMAVTDDVDWPWDAAVPARGPLAWVARNERAPGRAALPGRASWVAQATPVWSSTHLEDDAEAVTRALQQALAALLPGGASPRWHHSVVHRWRYAMPAAAAPDRRECWWDAARGLGVCGDFLAGGGVEAAWRSGDELADTVAASLEAQAEVAVAA
jgi:predicted NAD/FAD-dependent oxidoreductase